MIAAGTQDRAKFATLRRFAGRRTVKLEHCELCGTPIAAEHDHLLPADRRELLCACRSCALLFESNDTPRFRRVPHFVRKLEDFQITDAQWDGLGLPINLAFFYRHGDAEHVTAVYPGPAGGIEAQPSLDAWSDLAAANIELQTMSPDVEALLVNRLGAARDYFHVSIDVCFQLVGTIRLHWRGLSGDAEVWKRVAQAFRDLREMRS